MREVYGVAAMKRNNGFVCTSEEFAIKDLLIEGDDHHVHKELENLIKNRMVFDLKASYLLRAPYEEKITSVEDAETIFFIRIDPRELDVEAVEKNTDEWRKSNRDYEENCN